jgi:hypothetical protein
VGGTGSGVTFIVLGAGRILVMPSYSIRTLDKGA